MDNYLWRDIKVSCKVLIIKNRAFNTKTIIFKRNEPFNTSSVMDTREKIFFVLFIGQNCDCAFYI